MIGRTLLESGRNNEAVDAFRQALAKDPGWIPASVSLADLADPPEASTSWSALPLGLQTARIEAEIYDARPEVLLLATNGAVTFDIDTPRAAGRLFFAVDVRGTPAHGRFPELAVWVDGVRVSVLEATDPALPVIVELPSVEGETTSVSFVFDNDWADETGDRNVFFSAPTLYAGD